MVRNVAFEDWRRVSFESAWKKQALRQKELIEAKRNNQVKSNSFIFCEHDPVYTLGKGANRENLLINEETLSKLGATALKINRGGDITFHGPGQIVGYPILDLDEFFTDIHKYIRFLEEIIIRSLRDLGVIGFRISEFTGVWIENSQGDYAKVCAIGVHLSRWVTMHGFALNVNSDLNYFKHIIPCGIKDSNKSVTSIHQILGYFVDPEVLKKSIKFHFKSLFQANEM